jgi:hypothetical protein
MGTALILLTIISCIAVYSVTTALQYISPVAVIGAVVVLVIGMAWFKKSIA